jgi:hypothetical protein
MSNECDARGRRCPTGKREGGHGDQRSTPASTRVMLGDLISSLHYTSLSVSYLALTPFVILLC